MSNGSIETIRYGRWRAGRVEVDLGRQQIYLDGEPVVARPKVWIMLTILLRTPCTLVRSRDLMAGIWPNQEVDPKQLVNLAGTLRKLLRSPQALRSIPRRGYVLDASPILPGDRRDLLVLRPPDEERFAISRDSASAGPSRPFIGRAEVISRLLGAVEDLRHGRKVLIDLVGAPGVGKTRLVEEFVESLCNRPDLLILRGGVVDVVGHREPFGPLIQMLQEYLARSMESQAVEDLRRLAPCWVAQMPGVLRDDGLANLRQEVHGSSEGRMRREFTYLLRHWALTYRVVIVLEDMHWADASTLDWLEELLYSLFQMPLLVILTRRGSDYTSGQEGADWFGRSRWMSADGIDRIELGPFDAGESVAFVAAHLPVEALTEDLALQLHRMTGGLPLLLDLACRATDCTVASDKWLAFAPGETAEQNIVLRMQSWIAKRVLELPHEQIELLRLASCSAIAWPLPLLAKVLQQSEASTREHADRLVAKGLFKCWTEPTNLDAIHARHYDFAHAIYRETVKADLTDEARAALCRCIASVCLHSYPASIRLNVPDMALILSQAGMHAEAAEAFRAHSIHAMERFASKQAVGSLNDALCELDQTPRTMQRLSLQLEICSTISMIQALEQGLGADNVKRMQERILELSEAIQSPRAKFIANVSRCSRAFFEPHGRPDNTVVLSNALLEHVERVGPYEQEMVWFWAGMAAASLGHIRKAAEHYESCLAVERSSQDSEPSQYRLLAEGLTVWCLGLKGELASFASRLVALERERRSRRNPSLLALTLFFTADGLRLLGCRAEALVRYREALHLCEQYDQKLIWAEVRAGVEACLPAAKRDLNVLRRLSRGPDYGRHAVVTVLIETLIETNRVDEARSVMCEVQLVQPAWHSYYRTQMLRLQGDLLEMSEGREVAVDRWMSAMKADIKHGNLPGIRQSLLRIRASDGIEDDVKHEINVWADRVDRSLSSIDSLALIALPSLANVRLTSLLTEGYGKRIHRIECS